MLKSIQQTEEAQNVILHHKISIAPMMDITYEPFRVMFRYLSKCVVLYTEMIHEKAIFHNKNVLRYSQIEHPVVCQLGGNDPIVLSKATKLCEEMGYDEVNLNVGCPSERVQDGAFGACLMKEPEVLVKALKAMRDSVTIPVTIKCRLGVDEFDSYEFASSFVKKVSEEAGINHFIIHARKAFLKGLNPVENRKVPPLKYDYVFKLKQDFPHLEFSINGGIKTIAQIEELLSPEYGLTGCMIGRAAYENPWIFADVDRRIYGVENQNYSRKELLLLYAKEIDKLRKEQNFKASYPQLVKPIMHLCLGENHQKYYRHFLSSNENHQKYPIFTEFIDQCILHFSKFNEEALNKRPSDVKVLEKGDDEIEQVQQQQIVNEEIK